MDPSNPAPKSTITFTATVSGGTISKVYLVIKECKDNLCHIEGFNESMDKTPSGQYEKEITLNYSDTNNIEYYLVIKSDGIWYDFQDSKIQKDLNTASGNSNSNKTPGFELIVFVISIAILLFITRQKRVK